MTVDHGARMLTHLLRELEPHGIGANRITIEYQEDLQDYDVLINGGDLADTQIEGLRQALRRGGCVRFTNQRNTDRWHQLLRLDGLKILEAQAAQARLKYPDVPTFDRCAETLADFVRSLEVWAGAEAVSLTVSPDGTVTASSGTRRRITSGSRGIWW